MTGPEAIAAAERLRDRLRTIHASERSAVDSPVQAVYLRVATLDEIVDVLDVLRAALLQSQEQEARVLTLCHEWDSRAFYSNSKNNYATELRALFSPPVAPKER